MKSISIITNISPMQDYPADQLNAGPIVLGSCGASCKAYVDQQIQLYAAPKYFWLPQQQVSVGTWHNLSRYGVPAGAYAVRLYSRQYTGQGPVQTFVSTKTMAGVTISSNRNLNWVAALGSNDNAGAQGVGDFPLARTIGRVNEDTQIYVDSANYGCYIDGYWKVVGNTSSQM